MTTIYLLRHGALGTEARDRFVGQIDLPLSPEGAFQAKALGEAMQRLRIDCIYCSDLLRSRQTAEIIADDTGVPVEAHRGLREVSVGEWEGLSRQEVIERFPAQYTARGADIENYRIPGGESFSDCRQRVLATWRGIVSGEGKRVVVVGHAGANRVLLCHLLEMPVSRMFVLGQDYGRVNIVEYSADQCRVILINGRIEGV